MQPERRSGSSLEAESNPSSSDAAARPASESADASYRPAWSGFERREEDRREQPTKPWSRFFGPLRRARGRRHSDRSGYVDRYTRRDVALFLTVFLLNVGDAGMTLLWLDRGGREANPVMDFFLDIGPGAFLAQKTFVVGFWLVILLVHKNFRFARFGLYASLAVYAALMLVHFGLVAFDVEPPRPGHAVSPRALTEDELSAIQVHRITPEEAIERGWMMSREAPIARVARPAAE